MNAFNELNFNIVINIKYCFCSDFLLGIHTGINTDNEL